MALGFVPLSGAPLSTLDSSTGAISGPKISRFVSSPSFHPVLSRKVTRRPGRANAPGTSIDKYVRIAKQPAQLPKHLLGGRVERSYAKPDQAGKNVNPFSRFVAQSPAHQPFHPEAVVVRSFGRPNASGKNTDVFRRLSRQPQMPPAPILGANVRRVDGFVDPPPAPSTKRVPNLVRFCSPTFPWSVLDGRTVRAPKKVHFTAPGPTELLFLIRRNPAPRPPIDAFEGHTFWRKGHAADNSIPRTLDAFTRFLQSKRPRPDVLEGRVVRRKGVSQNIVVPPFAPLKRFIRRIRAKRPPPDVFEGRIVRSFGITAPTWVQYSQVYEQGYRVADDSLDLYELYVGEDGPPDFTAPPQATSATLPFSWTPTPPGSGTKTLHIVVRKRNKWNLQSFNVHEVIRVIDAASAEVALPVTAPKDVTLYDDETTYFRVHAKYESTDDEEPADTWQVYAKVGSDPVIGTDLAAYEGPMKFLGTTSTLVKKIGPYSVGDEVHVIVATRRDVDGEIAVADVQTITLAAPPDLDNGTLFGGSAYEQR